MSAEPTQIYLERTFTKWAQSATLPPICGDTIMRTLARPLLGRSA